MQDIIIELGKTIGLTPCCHHYEVAIHILEKLIEFGGIHVCKFTSDGTGFNFSYTLSGRIGLNYDELEVIRSIVNPARDRDHTVHQITMFEMTNLYIHPDAE